MPGKSSSGTVRAVSEDALGWCLELAQAQYSSMGW